MKLTVLIVSLFLISSLSAQVPEKAEDIGPLLIGETLPNATLQDMNGVPVDLQNIIKEKPTVLVFYRGGWCPYCNQQLAALAETESQIIELGYQIIAISPDHFEMLKPTMASDEVNYQVYSDANAELIQAIGIGFKTPEKAKGYIAQKTKKEASDILPVPAVFIVDKSGKIFFEYINPDYTTRISEDMILSNLKALQGEI
jgi:peroxiredoxin